MQKQINNKLTNNECQNLTSNNNNNQFENLNFEQSGFVQNENNCQMTFEENYNQPIIDKIKLNESDLEPNFKLNSTVDNTLKQFSNISLQNTENLKSLYTQPSQTKAPPYSSEYKMYRNKDSVLTASFESLNRQKEFQRDFHKQLMHDAFNRGLYLNKNNGLGKSVVQMHMQQQQQQTNNNNIECQNLLKNCANENLTSNIINNNNNNNQSGACYYNTENANFQERDIHKQINDLHLKKSNGLDSLRSRYGRHINSTEPCIVVIYLAYF